MLRISVCPALIFASYRSGNFNSINVKGALLCNYSSGGQHRWCYGHRNCRGIYKVL